MPLMKSITSSKDWVSRAESIGLVWVTGVSSSSTSPDTRCVGEPDRTMPVAFSSASNSLRSLS